jgi:2-haloacid dehalogenase
MSSRPKVVALDVVETVFALESLGGRMESAGLPGSALKLFFAQMLRDAFALEATAVYKPFRELAAASLAVVMANHGVAASQETIAGVLAGFGELSPHPDVEPALDRLRSASVRIIALTNGAAENTRRLFTRASLDSYLERVISIDEVQRWKPNREVYLHAARTVGVVPAEMMLVAGHAWDVHGAKSAGLRAAWVKRQDLQYHPAMTAPDNEGESMLEVASGLVSLPA